MISNPQHERFYPDEHNDRMPAFANDAQPQQQNILSPREVDLLVAWLRGEWYEGEPSSSNETIRTGGKPAESIRQPDVAAHR
jgi:hypothetical protein